MCISIAAEPWAARFCKSASRAQSAIVVPFDHARDSSAANSVSVNRADSIRFRASGRLEAFATGLRSVGVPIVQPQFWKPSTNVNAVYGELCKCFIAQALTFVYGRLR